MGKSTGRESQHQSHYRNPAKWVCKNADEIKTDMNIMRVSDFYALCAQTASHEDTAGEVTSEPPHILSLKPLTELPA